MSKWLKAFEGVETIWDACETIYNENACDRCPIRNYCINETSFAEFADSVTKGDYEEFIGFSEDIDNYYAEQDFNQYVLDEQLKSDLARYDRERL